MRIGFTSTHAGMSCAPRAQQLLSCVEIDGERYCAVDCPSEIDQMAVRRGRLFKLRLKRSHAARHDALASIRQRPDGAWQARIGGRMRGRTLVFGNASEARRAVHEHYNRRLLEFVDAEHEKRRLVASGR